MIWRAGRLGHSAAASFRTTAAGHAPGCVMLVIAVATVMSVRQWGPGRMNDLARLTIAFVQENQAWAAPLLFALAFCESFAFIAVWVPFVSILLAVGAVLGASGLSIWPPFFGAIVGAFAAQWLAYEMAFRLKGRVMRLWPLSHNEAWVARGVAFFQRRGLPAVFVGRFFGPLRAVTPFAAGMCEMPRMRFQIANLASAVVWSAGMLAPGVLGMNWLLGA